MLNKSFGLSKASAITPRLFAWKRQIRIFKVLRHAKRKLCVFACEKRAETQYIRLTCAAFVI